MAVPVSAACSRSRRSPRSGLPGLSGFVGEFLSLLGAWQSPLVPHWMTIVAAVGVLLAAAYMLWMVLRVVLGEPSYKVEGMPDATRARDRACSRRSSC